MPRRSQTVSYTHLDVYKRQDLTNYTATSGTVAVPAKIYVDGFSNAGAVGEYVVNVRFTGG